VSTAIHLRQNAAFGPRRPFCTLLVSPPVPLKTPRATLCNSRGSSSMVGRSPGSRPSPRAPREIRGSATCRERVLLRQHRHTHHHWDPLTCPRQNRTKRRPPSPVSFVFPAWLRFLACPALASRVAQHQRRPSPPCALPRYPSADHRHFANGCVALHKNIAFLDLARASRCPATLNHGQIRTGRGFVT